MASRPLSGDRTYPDAMQARRETGPAWTTPWLLSLALHALVIALAWSVTLSAPHQDAFRVEFVVLAASGDAGVGGSGPVRDDRPMARQEGGPRAGESGLLLISRQKLAPAARLRSAAPETVQAAPATQPNHHEVDTPTEPATSRAPLPSKARAVAAAAAENPVSLSIPISATQRDRPKLGPNPSHPHLLLTARPAPLLVPAARGTNPSGMTTSADKGGGEGEEAGWKARLAGQGSITGSFGRESEGDKAKRMAATQHGIDLGGGTGGGAREGTGPSHHTGEVASLGSGAESGRGQGGGIGVRNGSADGGSADLIQALLARIERAKRYSPEARRLGVEGTVEVQFTIDVQGRAKEVRVIRSSGSALLDAASVETVKRAEPLPPVGGVIRVPIAYRLRDRW